MSSDQLFVSAGSKHMPEDTCIAQLYFGLPTFCCPVHADQTAQLYTASNQFNPHEARAAKKKAKKQQKRVSGEAYDFAEAFGAKAAV